MRRIRSLLTYVVLLKPCQGLDARPLEGLIRDILRAVCIHASSRPEELGGYLDESRQEEDEENERS